MCTTILIHGSCDSIFTPRELKAAFPQIAKTIYADPDFEDETSEDSCFCCVNVKQMLTDANIPFTRDEIGDFWIDKPTT